jgi:hypothetical protein
MRLAGDFEFALPVQAVQPELADGFQHDKPRFFTFSLRWLH